MATYKEIKGTRIQTVSSDPPAPDLGQVWYNSPGGAFKGLVLGAASWATGGSMSLARTYLAGCGTQTAAAAFSGFRVSPNARVSDTEEYNGASWGSGGALPSIRDSGAGAGTQTAALMIGGFAPPIMNNTEEYDGSSWSSGGNLPAAIQQQAASGTQTAGLSYGGIAPGYQSATKEYNGASWTAGGSL